MRDSMNDPGITVVGSYKVGFTFRAARLPVRGETLLGDTFNAALSVALAEGKSLIAAAEFACRAGAIAVTNRRGHPGLAEARRARNRLATPVGHVIRWYDLSVRPRSNAAPWPSGFPARGK